MSVGTSETAVSSGGTNVLALLDQRAPTSLIPCPLGGFALGYLVAGASLGAAVGALAAGRLVDKLGRKSLLIGVAIGADSAIATGYIAEYAPRARRGALSILQQWMITVGILAALLVALVILWALPHSARTLDWRLILGVGAVPALIGVALRTRMPESPRWLLRHSCFEGAECVLAKLGIHVSVADIRFTAIRLPAEDERAARARRRIWSPGVKRALIVVCVFFIFQQISGINVSEVTAIVAPVNVVATYFAFRWIDRLGPSKISMGGYAGMSVAAILAFAGTALIAIGFIHEFLPETKNRSVEEITQLFERQAAGDRRAGMTSPRDVDAAAA